MIAQVLQRWHRAVETGEGLDELLAADVVFHSPVVHTPQHGRDITALYLAGARHVLMVEAGGAFTYTKQVAAGDLAVLEFETTIDGTYVNGVDVLRCDEQGRLVEIRVMVRPLQAVNAVHERMRALLQAQG